jgi:6-phosphofructokinase 1
LLEFCFSELIFNLIFPFFNWQEIRRRGLKVAVAGVPKTIDNDIAVIDKSFGFDSAVEEAQRAIDAAHVEASSAENGIGLVKLMGRYSG